MASNIVSNNFNQDDANRIIKFIFDEATVREDGLVNITALASAYFRATGKRKDTAKWLLTTSTTRAIAYLASQPNIGSSDLIDVKIGGNDSGTWVHPKLAELFAQWCSVEYAFAVVDLIQAAKSQKVEVVEEFEQSQRRLAPQRDLIDYIEAAKSIGIDSDPILLSLFSQRMAEQLGGNALPATQQVIATVRAHELGYSAKQIGNGSALGTFVKNQGCKPTGKTYHGKYSVNTYELTPGLDGAIRLYFS